MTIAAIAVLILAVFAINGFRTSPGNDVEFTLVGKSQTRVFGSSQITLETDKGEFELMDGGSRASDQYAAFTSGTTYRCAEVAPGRVNNCRRTAL